MKTQNLFKTIVRHCLEKKTTGHPTILAIRKQRRAVSSGPDRNIGSFKSAWATEKDRGLGYKFNDETYLAYIRFMGLIPALKDK